MLLRFGSLAFLALGALVCSGCGGETGPPTYSVTGNVTMGGSPVDGAVVTFLPDQGGTAAVGTTDASGNYTLTTRAAGDGAEAGQYKVTVTKYESPPEEETGPQVETGDVTAEDFDEYAAVEDYDEDGLEGGGADVSKNLLPSKFSKATTSGLTAEVTEGDNVHNFALDG